MEYEKELGVDFDIDLSEEHLRKKEKRYISMKRQKQHKQRLLYELHCPIYKPSIWREGEWDRELRKYIYTNRIKRGKRSGAQKCLKKVSCRKVRHLQAEALPPKGNLIGRYSIIGGVGFNGRIFEI